MAFGRSGFIGAACFSVCAVIFTMCGPLSPFESKGGFAPWFESEESYSTTHVVNYMDLNGQCDHEVTKTSTRWSMFGFDYVSETSCNSDSALQQASFQQYFIKRNRKVSANHNYVVMCENPSTDGGDSFCSKRFSVFLFWWLTLCCGLTVSWTAAVALFLSHKPAGIFCVVASFLTALFTVIGFAIGVSAKADLEDHLRVLFLRDYHENNITRITYEITSGVGLTLAGVAMVFAILLVPTAVLGLIKQLRKPVAKPEGNVEAPGPVLLDASNRSPKRLKEEIKEALVEDLQGDEPTQEGEPKEEPKEEPAEVAIVVIEEEDQPSEDERPARLAAVEMGQENEEHGMSMEARAALAEVLQEDKDAGISLSKGISLSSDRKLDIIERGLFGI